MQAVYVWLSTLAQGRFEENGIVLLPGEMVVKVSTQDQYVSPAGLLTDCLCLQFVPMASGEALDVATLKATLRVEHLQQHLAASSGD